MTVTTTATRLSTAPTDDSASQSMTASNRAVVSVFVGKSDVTTSTGVEVVPGAAFTAQDFPASEVWYGIVASSTARVDVAESGL